MKVYGFLQCYQEAWLIERCLNYIVPLVDKLIIWEGLLSPFSKQPIHSPDGTRQIIENYIKKNKLEEKICLIIDLGPNFKTDRANNREEAEGICKNALLSVATDLFEYYDVEFIDNKWIDIKKYAPKLEDNDVIMIVDSDEFLHSEDFYMIKDMFEKNESINHIPMAVFNFCYNLKQGVEGKIDGRFMRYKNGAKFGTTNHFIYPNGQDITRDHTHYIDREIIQHLSYAKHPEEIRNKVLSFNRTSFTNWYNNCYLIAPIYEELAYNNNRVLSSHYGWPGLGFLEGQNNRIESFKGILHEQIKDLNIDWTDYIIKNKESLLI